MDNRYVFHSTCFDKELFRREIILLDDNNIDYKVTNKAYKSQARAPLSGYFESDLLILERDFEKAEKLLAEMKVL